jgi:hypothetical protein
MFPWGNQNVTVAADVRLHCSQNWTTVAKQGAQKPALPANVSSEPLDLDEIAEDSDFTVSTTKGNQSKIEIKPNITETAINTGLPFPPTHESHVSDSSGHNRNQFVTEPRHKIPHAFIHYHFQGDMTNVNKDYHCKFQPTRFTTNRINAGIACQTSTCQDYLYLQSFLKENKVSFNLIKHNDRKSYSVVIRGILPTVIQDELSVLGWQFKISSQCDRMHRRSTSVHAHKWTIQPSTEPEHFAVVPYVLGGTR